MKKITVKALALLLALVMTLSFSLVGCNKETDDKDDDGDKKAFTMTKKNAEEAMVAAYKKLSDAKYFSGVSKVNHSDSSGEKQDFTITVSAQKDGDSYIVIGENSENVSGEKVNTYISGKNKFVTSSSAYAGKEFLRQDVNCSTDDVISILTDELFMVPINEVFDRFCNEDFNVTKDGDVYIASLTLTSYGQYCGIFIEEEYDPDKHGYFDEFSGSISFSVSKKGVLVGINVDMLCKLQGMEFTSTINTSISDIDEDKTVSEPEWYTNKDFSSGDEIYEVCGDLIFKYDVDRYGNVFFAGAFNNTYGEYESIDYYRILDEIGGEKVEYIDGLGSVNIKNIVVPAGVTLEKGYNDTDCKFFFEGEDIGIDFENPEFWNFYLNVNSIYAAGSWEMKDGLPTPKAGAKPIYPDLG